MDDSYLTRILREYQMLDFNRVNTLSNNLPSTSELLNPMQVPQVPVTSDFPVPMMYYTSNVQQEVPQRSTPNYVRLQTYSSNGYQQGYNTMYQGYSNLVRNEPYRRYATPYRQRLNQAVVKVNRINKKTTWREFKNLVRIWGPTFKIHLAKERRTDRGRGYGFVHYKYRSDAGRAIEGMNGLSFDNTILEAEWARQSVKKD